MAKQTKCCVCNTPLSKNELGLSKKLVGTGAGKAFCMDCLADYLDTSIDDLLEKIEDFKSEGCTLFE